MSRHLARARPQCLRGDRQLVAATMKRHLPAALASGMTNRRVIQHPIGATRHPIRRVYLLDRRRQVVERRLPDGDGAHPVARRQIGRQAIEGDGRLLRNRTTHATQQLFRVAVGERQRLVVIRLAGHASLDERHTPSIDDDRVALLCGDRHEDHPPIMVGDARHDRLRPRLLATDGHPAMPSSPWLLGKPV
jgi:hypothetical protein